jgi:hypothetical protein
MSKGTVIGLLPQAELLNSTKAVFDKADIAWVKEIFQR